MSYILFISFLALVMSCHAFQKVPSPFANGSNIQSLQPVSTNKIQSSILTNANISSSTGNSNDTKISKIDEQEFATSMENNPENVSNESYPIDTIISSEEIMPAHISSKNSSYSYDENREKAPIITNLTQLNDLEVDKSTVIEKSMAVDKSSDLNPIKHSNHLQVIDADQATEVPIAVIEDLNSNDNSNHLQLPETDKSLDVSIAMIKHLDLSDSKNSTEDDDDSQYTKIISDEISMQFDSTISPVYDTETTVLPTESHTVIDSLTSGNDSIQNNTMTIVPTLKTQHKPFTASVKGKMDNDGLSSSSLIAIILSVLGICSIVGFVAYKRVHSYLYRRHYARVDYLIDGLYEM